MTKTAATILLALLALACVDDVDPPASIPDLAEPCEVHDECESGVCMPELLFKDAACEADQCCAQPCPCGPSEVCIEVAGEMVCREG